MLKTPPLQRATETIDTLCGRLQSATLLEDRRGAILGLRSFSKQYPASVASGSLRELIKVLREDGLGQVKSSGGARAREEGGDVDTIRLVLETLLMLFNPDENSPEASEDIVLFMADEFSMRQDNVQLLLNLLVYPSDAAPDYYARYGSLQVLSAVAGARSERIQDAILQAPLGISRVVACLDDGRDAVRNAGLLLLTDLTSGASDDFRKIVAFEDVFPRIFGLIEKEGGLAEAGITAQDSLSLLANLVRGSASNQTMFRESGGPSQIANLLSQAFPAGGDASFVQQNRAKNSWGLLQLLLLFLVPGDPSTASNQAALFRSGICQALIDLAFHNGLDVRIRASSLKGASALISNNAPLQEQFAASTVKIATAQPPAGANGTKTPQPPGSRAASRGRSSVRVSEEPPRTYVIEALLDLSLTASGGDLALRSAACSVIQAYLTGHQAIKRHFLDHAISLHFNEQDVSGNVITCLLHTPQDALAVHFASQILQDILAGDEEAKTMLIKVQDGPASDDEDPVTFVQSAASNFQSALQTGLDFKINVAYATLLTTFCWECSVGVNDLLLEGSALLQQLVTTSASAQGDPVTRGMCSALLGTVYEFSTKDSPIPRRTIAPLLTQKLGRAKYLEALNALRRDPAIRDADLDADADEPSALSLAFVDFFQTEYSRLRRAVDKDPGLEVLLASAGEAGVDRDVLDDLRGQLQTTKDALAQEQQARMTSEQASEQAKMEAAKQAQSLSADLDRIKKVNEHLQRSHEEDLDKLQASHDQKTRNLSEQHQRSLQEELGRLAARHKQSRDEEAGKSEMERQQLNQQLLTSRQEHEKTSVEHRNAQQQLQAQVQELVQLQDLLNSTRNDLSARAHEASGSNARFAELTASYQMLQSKNEEEVSKHEETRRQLEELTSEVTKLNERIQSLTEELTGRDEELKQEREGFSALEKELEEAKAAPASKKTSEKTADAENGKVKELEARVEDAERERDASKEELDSMLMVMGELESKRDDYRARLRKVDAYVTETEDEDADEDEEDGDVE